MADKLKNRDTSVSKVHAGQAWRSELGCWHLHTHHGWWCLIPVLRRVRGWGIWSGTYWPASLANQQAPRSVTDPVSKSKMEAGIVVYAFNATTQKAKAEESACEFEDSLEWNRYLKGTSACGFIIFLSHTCQFMRTREAHCHLRKGVG